MSFSAWLFACCTLAAAPLATIEVSSERMLLAGKPVEVELLLPESVKAVSVKRKGSNQKLPAQLDPGGTLIFLLPEPLAPGRPQLFDVEPARTTPTATSRISVHHVEHQGHASIQVKTSAATWIYHKEGAGFGALLDAENNDWIMWRPGGGSAGEYRGIPNLGEYAHPGYTGDKGGTTEVLSKGPLRVRLRSQSRTGHYSLLWDFFPEYTRLTIEMASVPYWFLYEGTPGGKLDVDTDFVVTSDGTKRPVSRSWTGDLIAPEWVYFGDASSARVLFIVNHQDDTANDQFYQMEGNMTVFGFGREHRCCGRYMTAAPAQFTLGLARNSGFDRVRTTIESAWSPIRALVVHQ